MTGCFQAKVILVGDVAIGKTCLMNVLLGHEFSATYIPTTGPEFRLLHFAHAGEVVRLQMWDTAGQETYRSITRMYFRNSHIVLMCYAIAQRSSFDSIDGWLELISDDAPSAAVILVGTKKDLGGAARVSSAELEAKAQARGFAAIETSAATREGVEQLKALLGDTALAVQQAVTPADAGPAQAAVRGERRCC
jgi:small GTP-binding protein